MENAEAHAPRIEEKNRKVSGDESEREVVGPSRYFADSGGWLGLAESLSKGRYLVARRPIPAGQDLLFVPPPQLQLCIRFFRYNLQRFNLNFQTVDQVGGAVRGGRARESQEAVLPGLLPLHPPPTCQHPGASTGHACRVVSRLLWSVRWRFVSYGFGC